ncbi:TIGR04282 family arsenosugar biosynthesis glycosyltransferase [Nocardioides iriomotensis]|uniref:DUF2064 domain-containing protein n=1 Tax=Nocardioides iriomotensis TaxID=715784 RepID=A0A4Q5J6R3_9ACTN|nr:DUF2064 domain-containing protein [Nocardioides iriomotensis]RYU14330.1 DUF2064 domain-containing protein [Nocardioides iriomotensis]
MSPPVALVMAKAPVAGRAKTRLGRHVGADAAARLAAAALADTLDACTSAFGADRCYLALDGDLGEAPGHDELQSLLVGWSVVRQRGEGLGHRLAHAQRDVGVLARAAVVQIGMDTPQVTPAELGDVAHRVDRTDAVLGAAEDGGWWVLALRTPALARCLTQVAMSTDRTGADTRAALVSAGAQVVDAPTLRDVDEAEDAVLVAESAPHLRFSRQWAAEVAELAFR